MAQETQYLSGPNAYTSALIGGDSWTGTTGQPYTVSFSFGYSTEGGTLLAGAAKAAAQQAMQAWANVAGIRFAETGGSDVDLTFSQKDLSNEGAAGLTYSAFIGTRTVAAEVIIDSGYTNFPKGSYAYTAMVHELGHAISLKHPGNYGGGDSGPFLSSAEDSEAASIMSYNDGPYGATARPSGPMIYDIAAIQALYGANTGYHAGNDGYRFDATRQSYAIWDGGGNDTLYAPAPGAGIAGASIDLREGLANVSHIGGAYVWMAFGAHIENAVGESANDTIQGNGLDNLLAGGLGSDSIMGGAGNDVEYGGRSPSDASDGNDRMFGGLGNDTILGNAGNDTIYGGRSESDAEDGNDLVYGGKGSDALFGNSGNDALYGGGDGTDPLDQADVIYGGKGNDTLFGNGGNDTLYGGGASNDPSDQADLVFGGIGDDFMFGNGGNDTLVGGAGSDRLQGGAGSDSYRFESGGGADIVLLFDGAVSSGGDVLQIQRNINGSDIVDLNTLLGHFSNAGGGGVIDLGGGNSITIANVQSLGLDDVSFF